MTHASKVARLRNQVQRQVADGERCPECLTPYGREGRCRVCPDCGYSPDSCGGGTA